jgi:hypothetical protein
MSTLLTHLLAIVDHLIAMAIWDMLIHTIPPLLGW